MVVGQVRPHGVTDETLMGAMSCIPREKFLPPRLQGLSYVDDDIALGSDRYMLAPMVLARLLQAAGVRKTDVVLDIGCGTGYSAAILGSMAKNVFGIEQDKNMVMEGVQLLDRLGIDNTVLVHQADLHQGYARKSPYDVILINGAVAEVPEKIKHQLADGGRLVSVLFRQRRGSSAILISRHGDYFTTRNLFDAATPTLPGFGEKKGFVFQ